MAELCSLLYEENVCHIVGGLERVCVINDEDDVVRGKMRFSGDLVKRGDDGSLCYAGRRDDEVKRHGKRVHLYEIEQVRNPLTTLHFDAYLYGCRCFLYTF